MLVFHQQKLNVSLQWYYIPDSEIARSPSPWNTTSVRPPLRIVLWRLELDNITLQDLAVSLIRTGLSGTRITVSLSLTSASRSSRRYRFTTWKKVIALQVSNNKLISPMAWGSCNYNVTNEERYMCT